MIPAALFAAITLGMATLEGARLGHLSRRWAQGFLAVAVVLLAVHVGQTVPARALYAFAFYAGCLAVLALLAMVALWPILADLFDRPRKADRHDAATDPAVKESVRQLCEDLGNAPACQCRWLTAEEVGRQLAADDPRRPLT